MLIDAHAHLDRYEDNLIPALEEITQHGILTVSNSMDLPSYRRNLEIAEMCDFVLPTFGVHPWNASNYADGFTELSWAIDQSPMLGELGLDYYWVDDASQYLAQRQVMEFFLSAAREQGKILNLHTKGAEKDILYMLDRYHIQRAIVHWYSGPIELFRELVTKGMYFTIGFELLTSEHIQAIARELPAEQLLTETDNPGGPRWLTGSPGMPLLIRDVIQALGDLRETDAQTIIQTVEANFERLIRDDPWLSGTYGRFFRGRHDDA